MTWKNRITRAGKEDPRKISPNPRNWRKHPKKQATGLLGALEEVGWVQDVIVNERTGHLVDGHLRVELAIQNKEKSVPVKYVDLTEEEEALILATLDPITAMAEADKDRLKELLATIETESESLQDLLGSIGKDFSIPSDEPEDAGPQINRAAELMKEWCTESGQLWQLGPHRILCGDATRKEDMGRLMQGEKVDCIITDPPYGISIVNADPVGIGAPVGFGKVGRKGVVAARKYQAIVGDDKPFDPAPFLTLAPLILLFGANNYSSRLPDNARWLVWDKKAEKGADHNNFSDVELIWTNLPGKSCTVYRYLWSGLLREGDRKTELKDRVHPTQKPVGLFAAILTDFSEGNHIVLDPFLGSGTTLIACENLGRICRGMEIAPEYVAVTLQRYKDTFGKEAELAA